MKKFALNWEGSTWKITTELRPATAVGYKGRAGADGVAEGRVDETGK